MAVSIQETITNLYNAVVGAKEAKESTADTRTLYRVLSKAADELARWQSFTPEAGALAYFVADGARMVGTVADGFDREAGNSACLRAESILNLELLEGQEAEDLRALVAEWKSASASTTGAGRRSGESSIADLGFTVKVTDGNGWHASTTKDNLNSLRDQVRKHHESVHGVRPSKGDEVWQGLTDALSSVFKGEAEQAEGGGYKVAKAA